MGAGKRIPQDTLGKCETSTKTKWAAKVQEERYEPRETAGSRANPVLLWVNESNIVEVRALPPQPRPR